MPGIHAATHTAVVAIADGCATSWLLSTVKRTTMDMMRMLKSIAWTENCPNQALAMQPTPTAVFLSVCLLASAIAPETVLLRLFMKSNHTNGKPNSGVSITLWMHTCYEKIDNECMAKMSPRWNDYMQHD